MSQSFADDSGSRREEVESSAGPLEEQLAAEIADHLAAAASDLTRRGEAEDQAARLAQERFGDVARVKRQVWWIHNGEEVMFRTAGIALLSLLTIGVAVVGFGSCQMQRNLAARTNELSEQLTSLTATQQAMLAQQRPPEITGIAYVGDLSRPAKDVEIQVFRFSEEPPSTMSPGVSGVMARRLRTDAQGRFESGILQAGEYCVLAPLLDPEGKFDEDRLLFKRLQSHPLYLVAGVGKSTVDMNLLATSRIALGATSLPNSIRLGDQEVRVFVQIQAWTDGVYFQRLPVPPSDEPPRDGWPLPIPVPHSVASAHQRPADLPHEWWLPPRDYSVSLSVLFWPTKEYGIGSTQTLTKPAEFDLKLAPGATATATLEVLGDPLQKRFDDIAKELAEKLPFNAGAQLVLKNFAEAIELKVAIAMEEAVAAP